MTKIQKRIFKKQVEKYTKTFQSLPTQKEKSDNLPTTQSERNKIITKEEFLQTLKEDICCENYSAPLNAPYFLAKLEMIKLIETKGVYNDNETTKKTIYQRKMGSNK